VIGKHAPSTAASMGRFPELRKMILNFLMWCLFGLIAGTIAQLVMPGKDPGQTRNVTGYLVTIVTGILGAMAGGFIGSRLFGWDVTGFNLSSLAVAVGGAIVLLVLYRLIASGFGPARSVSRR
jgi:uncharacterized membrane protein YeaQ/YmgE (transglycosylase-associated protein family)